MAQLLATRTSPAGVPGPGRWLLDPARTRVTCSGRASRLLPTVRAWFAATSGEVRIAEDPADSALEVTIDVASMTTGRTAWDHALRAADPLSATDHPVATYRSHSIRWTAAGRAEIDGTLERRRTCVVTTHRARFTPTDPVSPPVQAPRRRRLPFAARR